MTTTPLDIFATDARRLVLDLQGLAESPRRRLDRDGLLDLIRRLGFVQVDSIQWVERAHHMILASRWDGYRQKDLHRLIETDRMLFENWTHDASILPVEFFPVWQHRFERERERLAKRWAGRQGKNHHDDLAHVLAHAAENGAVTAREMSESRDPADAGKGAWWDWKPSKVALEYHWRTGGLCICHRRGFQKAYALTEHVIPEAYRTGEPGPEGYIDWSCREALGRLGFGTAGEIAGYWGNITAAEAKGWCDARLGGEIIEVRVHGAGDSAPRKLYAFADIETRLADATPPADRLRILNPFDPVIRDRKRLKHLFDFDYRIEIFVPAPERTYGYYIFPLLEGARMIGRMEMKAARAEDALQVSALWPEPGVQFGKGRMGRLGGALERVRRLVGLSDVRFAEGWLRSPRK
ncbi:MAG: YcaQ family DNA glycosylase [Rhodospirillales bacterium]|nr:YcaQ family DNA glycosylase [Rhodospirillales bacterium]MBO6785852.1 YcaQ family DNA glycosylase [Rhodospirillales bacterium]